MELPQEDATACGGRRAGPAAAVHGRGLYTLGGDIAAASYEDGMSAAVRCAEWEVVDVQFLDGSRGEALVHQLHRRHRLRHGRWYRLDLRTGIRGSGRH